ncbi:uracil-DNA glycosylase [Aequorivita viscosa]|uniref:Uracil-DNA glycosylase n=1 Tax=Aequorivita viscosa TaxID=797419 RepID=A0A1M6GDJ5_9FLAO|nr:uracil-DNA glycosylase [Aequorivita viscosa]SDW85784.1 Uracil-DNA glycosylase [Aequorivita viscosa]SHJ07959.1 Uracil-DNA glycosylase [Aequorivita viscosa]
MKVTIEASWKQVLNDEFEKPYFKELTEFVRNEYESNTCYPPASKVFSAFNHAPFNDVKVVMIGQDPYHGPDQAHGLCFSVDENVKIPPSLKNIFEELRTDVGIAIPTHGNLARWADQGVLMLNATLTVRAHQAGSHQNKGWEKFTDVVIQKLSEEREGLVFMLWGGPAKKKGRKIDESKHLVLSSGHPSPLAANRGYWFGNKHFSKANAYLKAHGKTPIEW